MLENFRDPIALAAIAIIGTILAYHIMRFLINIFSSGEETQEAAKEEVKNESSPV